MTHALRLISRRRAVCGLAACALAPLTARAQAWPAKPIKLVVPWPPGGPTDTGSRIVGLALADRLGQPVVVENRPGASGSIAYQQVIKTPGDGTTFVMLATPTMLAPHLYKSASYHPVNDLLPVGMVYDLPIVLVVNAASLPKVTDLAGLIAEAKSRGGKLDYTSAGPGSFGHLSMELLKHQGGFDAQHIAYKGSPQALQDVAGGNVPFLFDQLTAGAPLVKAGKLKFLAVTTKGRSPLAPDVPTTAEAGFPGLDLVSWQAVYAPKGTPKDIVNKLNTEIVKALNTPELKNKLETQFGMQVVGSTPAELAAVTQKDVTQLGDLVRKVGATVD